MRTWKSLKAELLKDDRVAAEYQRLAPRYQVAAQLIEARTKKGLTQKELAEKVGTKQSAIARLEAGNINSSVSFLEKIATVMGFKLTIQISP